MPPELTESDRALLKANGVDLPEVKAAAPPPLQDDGLTEADRVLLYNNGVKTPRLPAEEKRHMFSALDDPRGIWASFKDPGGNVADPNYGKEMPKPQDHSIGEALAYPSGLTGTAVMETLKRATSMGSEGVGSKDWNDALKGEAKSIPHSLEEHYGMNPLAANLIGLPAQAITDPFASIMTAGALKGVPKETNWLKVLKEGGVGNAFRQQVESSVPFGHTIGNRLEKAGKDIFVNSFRKVDNEISKKYSIGGQAFGNLLWNDGKPIVKGNLEDIGNQADAALKYTGEAVSGAREAAGAGQDIHLSPEFDDKSAAAMLGEKGFSAAPGSTRDGLNDWVDRTHEQASAGFDKMQQTMTQAQAKIKEAAQAGDIDGLRQAAELYNKAKKHSEMASKIMDAAGQMRDVLTRDPYEWAKQGIRGTPEERAKAISFLVDAVPDLAGPIQRYGKKLGIRGGTREKLLPVFDAMLDNLKEGPRGITDWQDVKTSLQDTAASAEMMGQSPYANNSKGQLPGKSLGAGFARSIGDVIDGMVTSRMGGDASYINSLKSAYRTQVKGNWPLKQMLATAGNRQPVTFLEMLAAAHAAGKAVAGNPLEIIGLAAAKANKEIGYNPAAGVAVGTKLKGIGRSNLFDNILHQALMNANRK